MYHLQFPIGEYDPPEVITPGHIEEWIEDLAELPYDLRAIAMRMSEHQLKSRYRPGGWTGAQVIHLVCDSHVNSYMRFKLALTEDHPTIRPYDERLWAELPDSKDIDVSGSLDLLEQVQKRLVKTLRNMSPSDWLRTFYHPESDQDVRLDWNAGMYAWHGKHHLAHLKLIINR